MSCLKHEGRKHLFPTLFYDGAVSKVISIQPPFLASKALRRCGLLRKSKEGPACAMAPAAIFPFSHSARKSFRMLWPRGDQSPPERHLLKAPWREPREPEVSLDVAEHGLHVDGAPLPQGGPYICAQHLAGAASRRRSRPGSPGSASGSRRRLPRGPRGREPPPRRPSRRWPRGGRAPCGAARPGTCRWITSTRT